MDGLGEDSQAVGSAGSVRDDLKIRLVGIFVDTHHIHRGVSRGSGDDDLLGPASQVCLGLLGGREDTGGLDNVGGACVAPWDVGGVTLGAEPDGPAVDLQAGLCGFDVALDWPWVESYFSMYACRGEVSAFIDNICIYIFIIHSCIHDPIARGGRTA